MAKASTGPERLEDVTGTNGDGESNADATTPAQPAPRREPPPLPTEKTKSAGELHEKMVVLYGPSGIGKSTLASQWADGDIFFFNAAGELGELEVFQEPIPN